MTISERQRPRSRRPAQFWVGLLIILFVVGIAIFAEWLSPHDYAEQNLTKAMLPPAWMEKGDWSYPLGTDRLGRDLLSRLMYGARVSTAVGVFSVLLGGTIGVLAGVAYNMDGQEQAGMFNSPSRPSFWRSPSSRPWAKA